MRRIVYSLFFLLLSFTALAQTTYVNMSSPAISVASGSCSTSSVGWTTVGNTAYLNMPFLMCSINVTITFTTAGPTTLQLTELNTDACPLPESPCTVLGSYRVNIFVDGTSIGNATGLIGGSFNHSVALASGGTHTIRYQLLNPPFTMQFTARHNSPVMPVSLISWTVNDNKASWNTVMEKDILFYTLEGSDNGIDFSNLDTVYARNIDLPQSYCLSVTSDYNYYRLGIRELDYTWYSSVVSATSSDQTQAFLYPNPSAGTFWIICNHPVVDIEVMDMQGNAEHFSTSTFSTQLKGILLVKITTDSEVILKKAVVQ